MQNTPLSIRIIYVLTSIVYYISFISTVLGVVFALGLITGFLGDDVQLHTKMPVKANFEEVGTVKFLGKEVEIEVVEAVGKVHFIDTPRFVARTFGCIMLIVFPILLWLVFLFHRFVRNVNEGKIFVRKNFELLRKLGISLLVFWGLTVLYLNSLKYFVMKDYVFSSMSFSLGGNWQGGLLLGALFTLVLAHIFLKGLELKQENELTI